MSGRTRRVLRAVSAILTALVGAASVSAQLDGSCFVSALNRTARVDADGVWVLPNVPVNAGPVRVRATCIENGIVRSGQSDFVTIPPLGVVAVPEIDFTSPVPIPDRLTLVAPVATLTAAGETAQLQALVTYPGGGTGDVTPGAAGTDYRSSNPAIASVDGEGLVTARASGVVLVSAVNQGALGILRLEVVLGGDTDGDGLPDEWELAHGLNPNNPTDALEDPDQDGLSTLAEYQTGLDPFDSDTDDDGLLDGQEVETVHTNPALFDTDGDGLGDGLEVATGSDPLDPASFNLASALSAIEISPQSFVLVYNTLIGEGSKQLDVSGLLTDGRSIDLTQPRYATAFTSSDLAICNFGAEPGKVFAGAVGACTVTASNSGFSATAAGMIESFSPTVLAALDLPPFANDVAIAGDTAYVAGGPAGLHVIDVSDHYAPRLLATLPLAGNANDVRVRGNLVFIAGGSAGLHVVDATNPAAPVLVATLALPGNAIDLAGSGPYVYVADGSAGLAVVEVDPAGTPVLRGSLDTPGTANGVDVAANLAVVSNYQSPPSVIDVSDPTAPALLGTVVVGADTYDVALAPPHAYLASAFNLRVLDLSDPASPLYRGGSGAGLFLTETIIEPGGLLFATQVRPDTPVPIFRLSDPAQPAFVSNIVFSQLGLGAGDTTGLAADGSYLYATATRGFEAAYKPGTAGDTRFYVARYLGIDDAAGVPPTVAITSPVAGAAFQEGTSVPVTVAASDDVAVARVELLAGGEVVSTASVVPFPLSLQVPLGATTVTLEARAYDFGGNQATSSPVVVDVLPDPPPSVTITAPASGTSALEATGVAVTVAASDNTAVARVQLLVDGVLAGTDTLPPYSFVVTLPLDRTELTLTARAVDSIGKTATSDPVVISILADPPPVVEITSPPDGGTLVETESVPVTATATDNVSVASVRFLVNGVEATNDTSPPYGFSLTAPTGETSLLIEAVATDNLGRSASDQVVVSVEPDPGTTAAGRVLDPSGTPVAGAAVDCFADTGTTDASGSFAISNLPTLPGTVQCVADFTVAGGGLFHVTSAARPPVAGGVTNLGDLKPSPYLLYGGFSPDSFGTPSALALLNPDTIEGSLLGDTGAADGISGLAFDLAGHLLASTLDGSFGSRTSRLLEIDPDSGSLVAEIGSITAGPGGAPMSVGDLATQPATGSLFALRSGEDGLSQGGKLYTLDPATGVATLLGDTGTPGDGGLAFAPDGSLYTTRWDEAQGTGWLRLLDPADGSALGEVEIRDAFGALSGLAARPSDGLLFATLRDFTGVLSIDPATGLSAEVGFSDLGIFEDLAFRPPPPPAGQTTVIGRLVDNLGAPVEGALVTVRKLVWAESGADGRFTLAGVPVSFGDVVVVVPPGPVSSRQSESDPTPPIAGGTTDVGDIEVQAGVLAIVAGTSATLVPALTQPPVTKPPEATSSVARPQPSPAPAAVEKRPGGGGGAS